MSNGVGFDLSRQQRHALQDGAGLKEKPGMLTLVAQLTAGTDPQLINARLASAAARHEVLRSTLRRVSGLKLPVQVVHDQLPIGWLGVQSGMAAGAVVQAQRDALDVEQGPVLAAALVGNGSVLVLTAFATMADLPTLEMLALEAAGADPAVTDPIQYVEYAAWQQERTADLTSEDAENAAAAWQRLTGAGDPTILAIAAGESPAQPGEGIAVVVPGSRPPDLNGWLSAWVLTVARLTGSESVEIGVELDPRQDPELAGAAGPYTSVVPLTFAVPTSGPFAAFADQVGRDRDLAVSWLEWAPEDTGAALLFSVGMPDADSGREHFQLELRVAADGTAAQILCGSKGSVRLAMRVADALTTVLESSGGDVADADVLDAEQITGLLGAAPAPLAALPVIGRLVENARRHPDRPALTDGTRALTYGELIDRVDALAGALLDAGAGDDAPVATYLDRGMDLIVAMLAAQRAGAGYLALDVHQPVSRSLLTLQSVGARVLITDGPVVDGFAGQVVLLGSAGAATPTMPKPEQLSYVIFTSGSTGIPKGVAVSESALANYTEAIVQLVGRLTDGAAESASEPLRWALMTSPTTDLGNTAIFPALASGGTLHVVPAQLSQDPQAFAEYVREHRIDVAKLTPSQLGALLADERADVLPRRVLFLGGEALHPELVRAVQARGTCRLVNHYGPTETTVGALVNVLDSAAAQQELASADSESSVPIGWALPGNEALVLDSRRRLVPVGAVGELAISGAGLARGYWGDEAASAARFVAHPYRTGERMYLTGDLARRGADGAITFLGRRDGQVKIRGFRIERGEIESALRTHPGVARAAVVVRTDVGPDPQLVAYVVSQVNPRPTEAELHQQLVDQLPSHMVPARIVQLDTLPLRPNGKLDESALPVPDVAAGEHESPVGPTEESVAAIFASVLGVGGVGVTDDFFALGGHSLLATQIIVGIRAALDVQLPVYAVFEAPTVRGLAELVDQAAVTDVADDELARMIAELSELSDEEAAALLAAEGDGGGADFGVTEQR